MDWIKLNPPDIWTRTDINLKNYMGCDFAYTEQTRSTSGELKKADYTVHIVAAVDEYWNYYIRQVFREKCSKLKGIEKLFELFYGNNCIKAGLQKFDRSQIDEIIYQYAHKVRKNPGKRLEYISYPHSVTAGANQKNERIATTLQPLMEAGKLHFLPGMEWLEAELIDFPLGAHDDGLDALCNLVVVSKPPRGFKVNRPLSFIAKHIEALKKGRIRRLDGNYDNDPDAWKRI
jgi:phage terminase large subunit-like protein